MRTAQVVTIDTSGKKVKLTLTDGVEHASGILGSQYDDMVAKV